jgi:hypothetical protein
VRIGPIADKLSKAITVPRRGERFSAAGTAGRTLEAGWEWLILCPHGNWLAIPKEIVGDSLIDDRAAIAATQESKCP